MQPSIQTPRPLRLGQPRNGPRACRRPPNRLSSRWQRVSFLLAAPLEVSRLTARLRNEIQVLDLDAFVQRLGHVIDRQSGDGGGGESLHFDTGWPQDARG